MALHEYHGALKMKWIIGTSFVVITAIGLAGLMTKKPACSAEPSEFTPSHCSNCGCHDGLIPVCHSYCTTKKETKYRYYCRCETICIPDSSCCLLRLGNSVDNPNCNQPCCSGTNCSAEKGNCHCLVKEVYKLVKVPYTVETPVRKCTVDWICPRCGCKCGTTETCDLTGPIAAEKR
jgi:hypothetical protein